jgi:AraC family transcriptional regulator
MLQIDAIEQAIDFIEANLCEEIGVADMAAAVGYSLYHFCRTFNQVARHTPYDYLIRRRLAEAARALLQSDQRVGNIGADYYFNSPETFARAFRRVFGMLPTEWRRHGTLDPHLLMPRMTRAHLLHMQQGISLRPVLEQQAELHLAGVMTLVHNDPDLMQRLWHIFSADLAAIDPTRSWDVYQVWRYPPGWDTRGYFFVLGTTAGSIDPLPSAWVRTSVPAETYAGFIHRGSIQQIDLSFDYILHTWLPQSGYRRTRPRCIAHSLWQAHTPNDREQLIRLPIAAE